MGADAPNDLGRKLTADELENMKPAECRSYIGIGPEGLRLLRHLFQRFKLDALWHGEGQFAEEDLGRYTNKVVSAFGASDKNMVPDSPESSAANDTSSDGSESVNMLFMTRFAEDVPSHTPLDGFEAMTVKRLKDLLLKKGLPTSGVKAELVKRIREYIRDHPEPDHINSEFVLHWLRLTKNTSRELPRAFKRSPSVEALLHTVPGAH